MPLGLAVVWFAASPALGQDEEGRPAFEVIRYEEDWSDFRPKNDDDPLDTLKFVPLDEAGAAYLSFGGQARGLYEFIANPNWGDGPVGEDGVFFDRYLLHGDLHLGRHFRLFGQLISGFSRGEAGSPQGFGEDRLGVQNLFADMLLAVDDASLTLRLGRQQLAYGLNRLVNERDGTNIPRTFDAARAIFETGDWRVDAFGSYVAEENTGAFDDGSNEDVALWGAYAVRENALPGGGALDLYYLGLRDDSAVFDQGAGEETRHSVGARVAGAFGNWDYDWEAIGQFGSFDGGDIAAWSVATITGYTWEHRPWSPRLALEAAYASGDDDPNDAGLQTFNPLFPQGDYFSELGLLGPSNFFNVKPKVTVTPVEGLSVSADVNFFWRASTDDGVYTPARFLLRSGAGSEARFVATTASLVAEWQVNRNVHLVAGYTRSFPGKFIKETGESDPIDFVELELGFTF